MRVLVVVVFSLLVATCGQKGPLLPPPQDAPPAARLSAGVPGLAALAQESAANVSIGR